MTRPLISLAALLALAAPSFAQEAAPAPPSPAEIVDQAPEDEWVVIPPDELLLRLATNVQVDNDYGRSRGRTKNRQVVSANHAEHNLGKQYNDQ